MNPKRTKIYISDTVITSIEIITEADSETSFIIYFNSNHNNTVKRILNDICGDSTYWHSIYCVIDETKIADTIAILSKNNYLTVENKSDIQNALRKLQPEDKIDYDQ